MAKELTQSQFYANSTGGIILNGIGAQVLLSGLTVTTKAGQMGREILVYSADVSESLIGALLFSADNQLLGVGGSLDYEEGNERASVIQLTNSNRTYSNCKFIKLIIQ